MKSIFNKRNVRINRNTLLIITLAICVLLSTVVYAQVGGLSIYTKAGDPTELTADGKSQTRLMMDLSGCAWYPTAGSDDLLQVEFLTTLGTSASPPSINKTIGKVDSPFEVTLKAGSIVGTAKISATAHYCTEGNIMLAGQCSSKDEQDNPVCTGEFEIEILPAGTGGEEEETTEESEEKKDLSVSIACPPSPKAGESITCTASVSGAGENESLDYVWSLDGAAESKTKSSTFTWKGKETGYYEVGVEVFGKEDRTAKKDLRVNLIEGEASEEEEASEESAISESPDDSNLISSLESFLKAAGVKKVSPAQLAVAGTGVTALIAIWMIIQHRSGVPMEKLERAVGRWRWREGEKVPESLPEGDKKSPEKLPEEASEAEVSTERETGAESELETKDSLVKCPYCEHLNPPTVQYCPECLADIFWKPSEETAESDASVEQETDAESGPETKDSLAECPYCGHLNPPTVKYCPECLADVHWKLPEDDAKAEVLSEHDTSDVEEPKTLDPINNCPSCGEPKPAGVRYCPACGEKLQLPEEVADAGVLSEHDTSDVEEPKSFDPLRDCPSCGEPKPAGVKYCPACGENLKKLPEEVADAGVLSEHDTSDVEEPKSFDPLRDCPSCGEPKPAGVKYCPACGENIEKVPEEAAEAGVLSQVDEDKTDTESAQKTQDSLGECYWCGEPNPVGVRYCTSCGEKLQGR
jgi:membrane protease subunit (stomatin/prohibitin family)